MKLLSTGSVKNLWVENLPDKKSLGDGLFEFTNDYSVFDWGKMPQTIPDKGEALKRETAHWFKRLEEEGIPTHFIEDVDKTRIKVKLFRKLGYDEISPNTKNYMVPIEIIFRNKVTPVSSLHRRLREGRADPEIYGLPKDLTIKEDETIVLSEPSVEFSTKIEETDRYIEEDEVIRLVAISREEIGLIKETALAVNKIITEEVERRDLDHIDGKIEVALGQDREIYVCDTVGTSDENRFLYKGLDLSKQMIRDFYRMNGWYDELKKARNEGLKLPEPQMMDPDYHGLVNETYKALCVSITGELWDEAESISLDEIVKRYGEWIKTHTE
ncbi:MAG: phosphoribosylaminoimidazolesuccinocarboxamide synthase [Halobacteriota archaeon]|nr:phosphoribosylaminoimidazolesuccinocarboxamide synthase [Halobacteriota archaeon]